MITEIRIQGRPINIPNNLEVMLEEISPLESTTITVGDFSQSFQIPASPENRSILQFVDQLHLADRTIRFDDVMIVDNYFGTIRGHILIQESTSEFGAGTIDADFFTNLLGIDIFTEKLANSFTRDAKYSMGSTTAAIIAGAKAQNAAGMQKPNSAGAIMKFPSHFNAEHFDEEINPDWNLNAAEYKSTQAYSVDAVVLFQPNAAYEIPQKYICITAAAIGETPKTHPAKWRRIPYCVLNDWDTENDTFYANATEKIGSNYFQNFHALVPWLQLHEVIKAAAEGFGYTVDGEYLEDTHEQRALIASNYAQVNKAEYRVLLQLNDADDFNVLSIPQDSGPIATTMKSIVTAPVDDNDVEGLFDEPNQTITLSRKGIIRVRCTGNVWIDELGTDPTRLFVQLNNSSGVPIASGFQDFPLGAFPDGSTTQPFEIEFFYEYDYAAADGTESIVLTLAADILYDDTLGGVMTEVSTEVANITYQGVDIYDGEVFYKNHVPDITVADFFQAVRTWKNLYMAFDGRRKKITLNYADKIITRRSDVLDLEPHKVGGQRVKFKPKKRFELNYGVLPENTQTDFGNYQVLDPIDKIQDLDGYILSGNLAPFGKKAVLVKSLNAWLLTGSSKYTNRLVWKLHSQNWPVLRVEDKGDLLTIAPDLGPVAMGYFAAYTGQVFTGPMATGAGRSSGQPTDAEPSPFLIAYWLGIDTTTIDGGYPFATTTSRTSSGVGVLLKSMAWAELFEENWKKTLQTLVLEEIIKKAFVLNPLQIQKLNWQTIALLESCATLMLKKTRAIGTSNFYEMELRRLKQTPVEIVSGNSALPPGDVEFVNDFYEPYGLNFTIEGITDDIFTLLVSAPYNALITAVGGELSEGTCTITVSVNGVDITPATAVTEAYNEEVHDPEVLLEIGDEMKLEISDAAGGGTLNGVVKMLLIP